MTTLSENKRKMEENTKLINSNMELAAENTKVYQKSAIFGLCVILACGLFQIAVKLIFK